jgi:hypothetical protein
VKKKMIVPVRMGLSYPNRHVQTVHPGYIVREEKLVSVHLKMMKEIKKGEK